MRATQPGPLSKRAQGFDRVLGLILVVSLGALVAGLLLPAITVRSLFISQDFSLVESVLAFLDDGDWFLFVITFLFSVVFPVVKIVTGIALWFFLDATRGYARPVLGWLATFSKWSMLDVFIIALIVLVADGRLLSSADIQVGAIVFSVAVLVSTWATRRLSALAGNT
ncbi:MAG: paraquat-inducible protein A [Alphaproteobacteria bacterium]